MSPNNPKDSIPPASKRRSIPFQLGFLNSPALFVVVGMLGVALLIFYLISQASQATDGQIAGDHGAGDDDPRLPGVFLASQGGRHLAYNFTQSHAPIPYCEGVSWSGALDLSTTPLAAPDVYPRDVDIPREAIVHSLEHAGVFIAYNCAAEDQGCWGVVDDMENLVNKRIDNNDNRATMGYFSDLLPGEIALAAWTRLDRFRYEEYDQDRVKTFISTHSCRYDEEGVC